MSFAVEIPSTFTKPAQIPIRLGHTILTGNETINGALFVNESITFNEGISSDPLNMIYYDYLDISNINVNGSITIDGLISSNTITTTNLDVSGFYIHSNSTNPVNIVNNNSDENNAGIAINSNFDFLNTTNERNLIEWFSTFNSSNNLYAGISVKSYDDDDNTLKIGLDFKTLDKLEYATRMSLEPNGTVRCSGLTTTSDDRLKNNIQPITNAVETITKLTPQTYHKYNTMDGCGNYIFESGLIAQEIYYDVPELRHLVHTKSDSDNWGSTPASVNYIGLIPYCIQAIKEQQKMIFEQQDIIYEKNKKNDMLLSRIQALELT